jgi:hypothetical protein
MEEDLQLLKIIEVMIFIFVQLAQLHEFSLSLTYKLHNLK